MEMLSSHEFWIGLLKIIWVNLLLSGDNAVVIALAARSLPPKQQMNAIIFGSGAAIVLRIILTLFAVALLTLPWLKIVGGLLLLWIGVQLLIPEDEDPDIASGDSLMTAIRIILIADLVMSLDNVLAVAAAADQGPPEAKVVLLVLGLAISIPIVIFGATVMMKVMERYPIIITAGGALLGWISGEMIVTDPAIVEWIKANAGWMDSYHAAAIFGAVIVLVAGSWLAKRKVPVPENEKT